MNSHICNDMGRSELVAALLAPYKGLTVYAGHGRPYTAEYGLAAGAAEIAADALLRNPGSAFWNCEYPLETGADGAALRWMREVMAEKPDADGNFDAFASVPGLENSRRTAKTVRWMFQQGMDVAQAIAYTSPHGDYEVYAGFPDYIRERLIHSLPQEQRETARRGWHNEYAD